MKDTLHSNAMNIRQTSCPMPVRRMTCILPPVVWWSLSLAPVLEPASEPVVAKVLALGSLSTYTFSHIETLACNGPLFVPHILADSSPLVVHNHNHHPALAWGREMVLADSTDMTLSAPHTHAGNGHILLGTYSSHKLACCSLHQGSPLV